MRIFHKVAITKRSELALKIFMSHGNTKAWIILISAWSFYFYEYILRVSPSVMTDQLVADFGVTASALGLLTSFYYWAYVPLQIPCGMIVDTLGPRFVISMSALLCVCGTLIFSFSSSLVVAQLGRLLMGAGSACAYIGCAKIATSWFKPQYFAMITCIGMFLGTLGGMIGGMPVAAMVNHVGWRGAMHVLFGVGVFILIQAWIIIRDTPNHDSKQIIQKSMNTKQVFSGLAYIASNPQSWIIFMYGCMIYLPLSAFAEFWGVPFLMKAYNISNTQAASGTAAVFLGMGIGSIAGAWLSDLIKSRRKIMVGSALGTLLIFMVIFLGYKHIPFCVMMPILFLGGLVNGGQTLYFTSAKEVNPPEFSATSIGFTNCGVMLSGVIFQPLFGIIMDMFWNGAVSQEGTRIYDIGCYQKSCMSILIAFVISAILAFCIKETYPQKTTS